MEPEHGGLSRKLTALHVFDRPIDFEVLSNGGLTDEPYEANFLRPLLRETISSVFSRLFLADVQQYTNVQVQNLLTVSVILANLGGELLYFYWNSTSGFNPALNGDMRRDIQGVLLTLSWYLFNANSNFMQHNVYPPQPLYTGPCTYAGQFNSDMLTHTGLDDDIDKDGLEPAQQAQQDALQDQPTVADLINIFGEHHGLDVIVSALQAPDRCGLSGVHMFINVLSFAMQSLLPEYKEEIRPSVQAVLKYIEQGFSAASDFSVFEDDGGRGSANGGMNDNGGDDGQPAYHTLTLVLHGCCDICNFLNDGGLEECGMVAPLQRELVSRLLRSGHFTRQLAAVKELYHLHTRAARWSTGSNSTLRELEAEEEEEEEATVVGNRAGCSSSPNRNRSPSSPASLQAFIDWICAEKIVDQILRTNLHQPQYAEAAQRLLVHLARHGTVTTTHISFLWDLIEDAATFEDIKVNVCSILGALTPHLPTETQRNVLQRAAEMALSESPPLLTLSLKLLESISRNDSDYAMPHEVLNTLCSIILRTEAPLEAATSAYLSDACLRYIDCSAPGTDTDWARLVTEKCTEALKSGKGGVPAAYQLFETFTKIVPAYFPKPELERAFFEDINANAKLFVMGMDAYSDFLAHQRAAMAAAGTSTSTTATAPPVGCISHAMAVEKYHRMLSELIVRGNYYITSLQLNRILRWATVEAATAADSDSSWRLLMLMVHDRRKEIEIVAANRFLTESLCAVEPQFMSWYGWQCLTLYMAAVNNWNIDVKNREGYENYDLANDVGLSSKSQWPAWRSVLLSTALHAEDPAATQASVLLSRLVAHDAQAVFSSVEYANLLGTELSTWQNELETAVSTLCGRLPERGWHDAPPLLVSSAVDTQAMKQAANTAKRALLYLQQLIENGQAKSLPVKFSHAASYRESTTTIDLQLPSFGVATVVQKLTISLPKNSYVGVLRAVAAEKVSTAIGRPVSPANLRLFGGGKELLDDGVTINRDDSLKSTVMLAFSPRPNPAWELSTLPQAAREELTASGSVAAAGAVGGAAATTSASEALVAAAEESPNCNIYSLALTMEQIHSPEECEDEMGSLGHLLRGAAKGLLNALPTCTQAINDVQSLLLNDNATNTNTSSELSRTSLLRIISSPDGTYSSYVSIGKVAVMRYLIEALCVLILPANNPLTAHDVTADHEMRAAALQTRLFASNIMPTLLEVAAAIPATPTVSAAADHQLHVATILLANAVSEDILNRKNFAVENVGLDTGDDTGEEAQQGDITTADGVKLEDTLAVQCIAIYTLAMMHSSIVREEQSYSASSSSLQKSHFIAGGGTCGALPRPLKTTPDDAVIVAHWTDDLCYKALHLLRTCIDAVPTLATFLVSPSSPSPPAAALPEGKVLSSTPHADRLSSVILTLLSHPKQALRATVNTWIHHFVAASAEARSWTFSNIVTPLLLAIDSNDDQTFLISSFLSNLNAEEAIVAEGVLGQLVDRFVAAVDGGDIGPVKATVESILILIRRLDCHSIAESSGLVNKLLQCCLFPELDVLASAHPEPGRAVSIDIIFEAHPRALRAAQHSIACRDVCFELLSELMTHNRASWDAAHPLFMRLIDAGASIYPNMFRNGPLPSLRSPGSLCGLCNGGATCYMNATFQQLFMQPTVRRLILSAPAVPETQQLDSVFHQVQTMFAHLAAGVAPYFEPRGFWRAFKDYEGQSVNIREHQDAYEFFTRLQDSVDEHLRSEGHPRAIHAALGGTFAQVITVAGRPELRSQRNEDFYQVSLDVRGKKGLTESLESYVAVEMMNGENQWLCEELGKKVDAEKRTLIGALPNTLMLHLKRFEWDYETYSRWKVKDRFEFPLKLDMKPYTVEGCAVVAAAAGAARDATSSASSLANKMHPDAYYKYELRGIVVHSGTAFAGHYYSYIKDRTTGTGGTWNLFDDTSVDPWDPVTLEEDCFGGKFRPDGSTQEYDRPNSAYMLIYERIQPVEEDLLGNVVAEGVEKSIVSAVATASGGDLEEGSGDELMISQGPGAEEGLNLEQQEAVARLNLANIAMVHLFAPELHNFFTLLARELRLAAAGGSVKSRKIARGAAFTSPSNGVALGTATAGAASNAAGGTAAKNSTGLARMTSRHRPEEIDDIVASAIGLCCDYFYNVLARGPLALINDLSARKGESFVAHLNSTFKCSKLASSILLQLVGDAASRGTGTGTGPSRQGMALALSSPHRTIREGARTMLSYAVKVVIHGFGPVVGVGVLRPVVDSFMDQLNGIKKRMAHPLSGIFNWDEVLAFLNEILSEYDCLVELAMPHLDTLLAIGRPLVDGFWSLSDDDKLDFDFGKSYLSLLAIVLCRYDHTYLSSGDGTLLHIDAESIDGGRVAIANESTLNPYCFNDRDGTPSPPLPRAAWDFLFEDETFFRRLLMPSCITSANSGRLLQWLWYNNYAKHMVISRTLLDHVDEDVYNLDELLACELPQIVDILTMKDVLSMERYKVILLGENENEIAFGTHSGGAGNESAHMSNTNQQPRWGLIEMTQEKNRIYRVVMLIRVIASMHKADENIFFDAVDQNGNETGKAQDWARYASGRVDTMRHNLRVNTGTATRWQELANECIDAEAWFQLDDLSEQLAEIANDYEYEDDDDDDDEDTDDVNPGNVLQQQQQQYPQPTVGPQSGFGIHESLDQAGNTATSPVNINTRGAGFAYGLLQTSVINQQHHLLALQQQQQQAQLEAQQRHGTTTRGIVGPAVVPPHAAVTPASTPFASMDLGAPPLQGPAVVVTQGAGSSGYGTIPSLPRQADISAGCVMMGGNGNQDDEDDDDDLVAEIELDGSGCDDENGDDADGGL
ncbi:putative Ubiquitin carboxyl-terminal hydrolase 24 [Nannochloris sp. 'desiccata']|nr:hypothetical protein KSW81_001379 [Chlorella desiccata (nom. nud.)]KAH7616966.1 putative Ubiquitin carboxyl-terminal hydrolase 24 [Chlorella desiccata (nom. nud.)]